MKNKKTKPVNGKLLYFRRYNEEGYTNAVIIGDESKVGGRDLAYTHKGLRKFSMNKAGIESIDGDDNLEWPRIFNDIKLNSSVTRDYDVHAFIKYECDDLCEWDGEKDEGKYSTREAFIVNGEDNDTLEKNIDELHERIEKFVKGEVEREIRPIYEDTKELITQIMEAWDKKSFECPHIITELATRYGKTQFGLSMFDTSDARIMVLTGYVGTIISSIRPLIRKTVGWEHYKVIEPDDYDNVEDCYNACEEWLNADDANRIIYWVAVTGTSKITETSSSEEVEEFVCTDDNTTFERRIGAFMKLMKDYYYSVVIDEVDFGAHCDKQQKKLRKIANNPKCYYKLSMTGTNADYAEKIWPCDLYFSRDYFDLLSLK